MLPIFFLTVRALGRGRRLLVVSALLAVPSFLALAFLASLPSQIPGFTSHDIMYRIRLPFVVQLFDQLVLPILLPLTALIFATTALGDEVEDRTLVYLTLRPVSRLSIVVSKLLAAVLLTLLLVEASLVACYLVTAAGAKIDLGLVSLLLAGLGGCVAYSSIFLLLGLLIPRRALLAGFLYVLIWEGAVAAAAPALATLSVRRYVEGILHAGLPAAVANGLAQAQPPIVLPGVDGTTSAAALAFVLLAGIGLSTWGLRRIQLP